MSTARTPSQSATRRKAAAKTAPKQGTAARKRAVSRVTPRKPAPPAWVAPFRRYVLPGLVLAAVIIGGDILWRAGILPKWLDAARGVVVQQVGNAGWRVRQVTVTGRNEVSSRAILAILGAEKNTPIFAIDLPTAQKKLEEISWIKSATIRRILPDRLEVVITERQPLALWQMDRKLALIDADGVVLTRDNLSRFAELPIVVGKEAPQLAPATLKEIAKYPAIQQQLAALTRIGGRRWDIKLKSGTIIRLPEEGIQAALITLNEMVNREKLLERDMRMIDLRLPGRVALQPADSATLATHPEETGSPAGSDPTNTLPQGQPASFQPSRNPERPI